MAYADASTLAVAVGGSAKLIQLTDDDGDRVSDPAVITAIISEAEGFINGYVRKVHNVPLTNPPISITSLCNKIAARIARRRRGMPIQTDAAEAEADTKWLEGVANGMITLGVQPEPEKSDLQVDKVGVSVRDMSRDKTRGFW